MMKTVEPIQRAKRAPNRMVRCLATLDGTVIQGQLRKRVRPAIRNILVALSPCHVSTPIKARDSTPNRTKRATTLPFDQAYVVPPHSSARSKQISAAMKNVLPMGSKRPSQAIAPPSTVASFCLTWRKARVPVAATAPIGTVILLLSRLAMNT
jgi:hypothetical protein